jgi:hypothetical protein
VFAAVTGLGSGSATGCGLSGVSDRTTCAGSPAATAGFGMFGYPCFREQALPIVLLATDEPPLSGGTNTCPTWTTAVLPALQARGVRFIGVVGSSPVPGTEADLQSMATATGAVDATNGNAPLVFPGAGTQAATAIGSGVQTLVNGVPLDLTLVLEDDPADAVAAGAFLDHVATRQTGDAGCSAGVTEVDENADGVADAYVDVASGTTACWTLVPRANDVVSPAGGPQVFHATLRLLADGVTVLGARDVHFVVPPLLD